METIGTAHVIAVHGTTVAWSELGSGMPLVLLHGMADSHRTWRRLAPRLTSQFRVLMPDLPGHGYSGRPDAPYTLDWYANVVAAWMQAIGVQRAVVTGHSYGGGIAQWMLLHHHERIARLGLIASGGLGPEVAWMLRLAAIRPIGRLMAAPLMGLGTHVMCRLLGGVKAGWDTQEAALLAWMNMAPGSGRALARTIAGCINLSGQYEQTWTRFDQIQPVPPIALFWGDRDPVLPIAHGRIALQRFNNVSLSIYPNCGHFPHLEDAGRLAQELASFALAEQREQGWQGTWADQAVPFAADYRPAPTIAHGHA